MCEADQPGSGVRAMTAMKKSEIDQILDRVRTWPMPRQQDAARILLAMEAQDPRPYQLSDDERADIDAALEEFARGEIATDEEVGRVFDRYRA